MTATVSDHSVLIQSLLFAVPLWMHELRDCTEEQVIARAKGCAQVIAEKGDALQFKAKSASSRKSTAHAFNRLAEGLACAAYQPGGVTFAGLHWCVGSRHSGVAQELSGPCIAEVERERTDGPAAVRSGVMTGLPRSATPVAHGYSAADIYDLAVLAVRTDRWRPTLLWAERVEAAWSAIACALVEEQNLPSRRDLVIIARDASADVIDGNMRHRGIDKRAATFGERRVNFDRYWFRLPGTPLADRVVDDVALSQIWPCLAPGMQEALIALVVHGDYAVAAESLGLKYYTFCARVRHARLAFLRYWHEGEVPSSIWGRDKLRGRGSSGRTAVRVHARSAKLRSSVHPDGSTA